MDLIRVYLMNDRGLKRGVDPNDKHYLDPRTGLVYNELQEGGRAVHHASNLMGDGTFSIYFFMGDLERISIDDFLSGGYKTASSVSNSSRSKKKTRKKKQVA